MRVAPRSIARAVVILAGLVLHAASGFAQPIGEFRPAPRFEGTTIPDPPRQREPWQPPATTLPRSIVDASALLFEQGLADPRGCDYRVIEIAVGHVWSGDGGVTKTRGWVLPARGGDRQRFAVAWSGLVYPVVSVGEPADPSIDVEIIVRGARAGRPNMGDGGFGGFGTNNEASSVSPTSLHAIKVCLLLRLGRSDLAEKVWAAGANHANGAGVSYVSLANDLAWHLFDRAVCAHMRGDDAIALADARRLTTFRKAAEDRARVLGFERPRRPGFRGEETVPYIDFLGQLPDLLADQERRAREPRRPPVPPPGADKSARIAALIAELDQVAARQFSQPGGVSLGQSPIVQALIDEGDDAVGPLIDALERDTRLTRSVHFWRDFHRSRTIMGAHEAAYTALVGILKTPFFGAASTGDNLSARGAQGRKAVADLARAYWEKNRGIPLVERWYRTLADDGAGPQGWLQAAGNIVQHENVAIIPGSTAFTSTVTTPLPPGARPRLRGEALRAKRGPSVAELMARRVDRIDPGGPIDPESSDQFKLRSANQMAEMLADWDSQAALPVLKARVGRCARASQAAQQAGKKRPFGIEGGIAGLTKLRIREGDGGALDDYAAWVRTVTPDGFQHSHFQVEMFEPLWDHPDHPAIVAAAAALFEDPKSPWNPSSRPVDLGMSPGFWSELLQGPLLGMKSFRTLVIRALGDRTQVGTIESDGKGTVIEIQGRNRTTTRPESKSVAVGSSGGPEDREDPFKPGPSAMPLRLADQVCDTLQSLPGVPRFQKAWPLARRDEALAACTAFLRQYGDRFRENEASRAIRGAGPGIPGHEQAILAFDPLDRPATAADVAEGRAIFSLQADGAEVRRVPMPSLPLDARWTKLEVFPDEPPIMTTGDGRPYIEGLQTGRVWQAEEVREGDRWRRYYGFVGRHALKRVAAEEIEFPAPWNRGWSLLSADLDGRIVVQDAATTGPVPIEFSFRNHRGVEATAPADLVRGADDAPTIREGIAFRLVRASDKSEAANPFAAMGGAREKPFPPEEIPGRPVRRHPGGTPARTLEPAGSVVACRLDLRTLFPIDRPGRYRLEITFDDLKTSDGKPAKVATDFAVVARKSE